MCHRSDGRQDRDFLPAERLGRDQLRLGGSRRLPGRHHAGFRARRGVKVLQRVRSCFECDRPLVPGIAHRAMGSGRGGDLAAVDDQEAAILARREELVVTGRADPQGAGIEAQERLGAGCQRVEAVEDVRDVNTADRFGRGECLAHGAGLVQVAGLPAAGLQHQTGRRGPRGRLAGGVLAAVVDRVASAAARRSGTRCGRNRPGRPEGRARAPACAGRRTPRGSRRVRRAARA